jgi:hypothetical protein
MSKGYKKEYIDKVKAKINDLQSGSKKDSNAAGKPSNNKDRSVHNADRVDRV